MSRIRVYADEDSMSRTLVKILRTKGEDITTAYDQGKLGLDDEDQLAYAIQLSRCIFTCNVGDFCRIHSEHLARGDHHYGIVVCQFQGWSASEQARRLRKLLDAITADEMRDRLEYL